MHDFHIVGDIHGHADKLEQLLEHLGYEKENNVYQQDNAKVLFLGDFIDRGPHQRRVIDIVRPMVDAGHALAVMGNHEFNAICYHTPHPETDIPLRAHSEKNTNQHQEFLNDYSLNDKDTGELIDWFKRLPLYMEVKDLENDGTLFRAVHACWNKAIVDRTPQYLKEDYILEATTEGSQAYKDIEVLLKGPEIPLPKGSVFQDKSGIERDHIRIQWWSSSNNSTYREVAMVPEGEEKNIPTDPIRPVTNNYIYPEDAPPVFFGHYWLTGKPRVIRDNLACLDYSAGIGGALVAYHWRSGESEGNKLENGNFAYVENQSKSIECAYQDQLLRYLASFEIQFNEPYYGDPQWSREIVMTYKASTALPVLEAYCNLNNIPFTRPAGPVRMIELSEAIRLEQLLAQYRANDWTTNTPISLDQIYEIERRSLLKNIVDYHVIGRTNAGWKIDIQFRDQCNGSNALIGAGSTNTDSPNQFHYYFRNEEAMSALIDELRSLKTDGDTIFQSKP